MHSMKGILWIALSAILGFTACNYTDGPCYRREDIEGPGSDGVGGGPIVPGWGGYGDVPPDPQEGTDPPLNCNRTDEPDSTEQPDQGTDSGSCSDIPDGVTASGDTYAHCSGPCEAKCLSIGAGSFAPAIFKFTTVLPDDGSGEAGGWQAATAGLNIVRWESLIPEFWTCTVKVGMPLRTVVHGKISAETAASVAAGVATQAAGTVRKIQPPLPQGIFCVKLKDEMTRIFKNELKSYGARMENP